MAAQAQDSKLEHATGVEVPEWREEDKATCWTQWHNTLTKQQKRLFRTSYPATSSEFMEVYTEKIQPTVDALEEGDPITAREVLLIAGRFFNRWLRTRLRTCGWNTA